jgi:hypothetical protein
MPVKIFIIVFRGVMSYNLEEVYQCFGETYGLHLQAQRVEEEGEPWYGWKGREGSNGRLKAGDGKKKKKRNET